MRDGWCTCVVWGAGLGSWGGDWSACSCSSWEGINGCVLIGPRRASRCLSLTFKMRSRIDLLAEAERVAAWWLNSKTAEARTSSVDIVETPLVRQSVDSTQRKPGGTTCCSQWCVTPVGNLWPLRTKGFVMPSFVLLLSRVCVCVCVDMSVFGVCVFAHLP